MPIIRQFQARHGLGGAEMVVAADAGMLSASNLKDLDAAGCKFIVGSRMTKDPADLASHFHWHGDLFTDGQLIDTVTPRHANAVVNDSRKRAEPAWDPREDTTAWRAVWHYSAKRARRDVIDGRKSTKSPRFVTTRNNQRILDEAGIARARSLTGLKGYVTNLPAQVMGPGEVLAKYHDLWHVEQSFRMSKTDLRARPIFHHQRDAIEAHLTVVFTALAVSRHLQHVTGVSIRHLVRTLRPIQEITVRIAGHLHTATDPISPDASDILAALETPTR